MVGGGRLSLAGRGEYVGGGVRGLTESVSIVWTSGVLIGGTLWTRLGLDGLGWQDISVGLSTLWFREILLLAGNSFSWFK